MKDIFNIAIMKFLFCLLQNRRICNSDVGHRSVNKKLFFFFFLMSASVCENDTFNCPPKVLPSFPVDSLRRREGGRGWPPLNEDRKNRANLINHLYH
ncbi:hypothetical protein PUN28_007298 [Cardiocondyla obscurior]|uniref:Secreted protein n=1 Tax=Cardiocondyla obscurior TaxID=286306 RepID=A0AAW2G5J5_9HYME